MHENEPLSSKMNLLVGRFERMSEESLTVHDYDSQVFVG